MIIDLIFENQPKQEEDQRRIGRGGTCWSSMHQRSACRIGYHYPNCALCMLPYWVKNIAWGEFVPHPSPLQVLRQRHFVDRALPQLSESQARCAK